MESYELFRECNMVGRARLYAVVIRVELPVFGVLPADCLIVRLGGTWTHPTYYDESGDPLSVELMEHHVLPKGVAGVRDQLREALRRVDDWFQTAEAQLQRAYAERQCPA